MVIGNQGIAPSIAAASAPGIASSATPLANAGSPLAQLFNRQPVGAPSAAGGGAVPASPMNPPATGGASSGARGPLMNLILEALDGSPSTGTPYRTTDMSRSWNRSPIVRPAPFTSDLRGEGY